MNKDEDRPEYINKVCEGCNKEFMVPYKRRKQRFCSKLCAQHSILVKNKIKESQLKTYESKYGVTHPMKVKTTVDKLKKTMLKKYGVEHALQNSDILAKSQETKLKKYGDKNFNNIPLREQTCLSKYGVKNYVYTTEYKDKTTKTCLDKYGILYPSQSIKFIASCYNNMFEKFNTDPKFSNFTPMFTKDEYCGVTHDIKKYKFKCKRCGNVAYYNISNGLYPQCINCDKLNSSKEQKEIYDFLKTILGEEEVILMNERSILFPKEIDIYIPKYNLAIEYNSLYWHSEISGCKNKTYHINKTKNCILKGINLIHIFQTDWIYKKEITKSIIKNFIKKNDVKIYGKLCEIKEIPPADTKIFLNKNHIQGSDNSSIHIGLFYNNELVSVMTFGKSRFDKKVDYEIYRFCNKINTSVVGGASKLFDYFIKTYNPNSILTYSDRRYFNGNLYLKLGFVFQSNTPPNYYYIYDNYSKIQNRIKFQKHKLAKLLYEYNSNLTEWENMKNNGYDRIWDCGCCKWIWKKL